MQAQIDMLIKLVYFEDEAFEKILIKDLIEIEQAPSGGGGMLGNLGGLEQLLQGQNMEGLMKMLSEGG